MECGSCKQSGRIFADCNYCDGTGTIPETFCHCGKPTNNVGRTLCNEHIDELRAFRRKQEADRLATMRAQYTYFIPDGDLGVDFRDEGTWRSYNISGACGDTMEEFLADLSIEEIDQDGGELNAYSFDEAPSEVQKAILSAIGLKEAI